MYVTIPLISLFAEQFGITPTQAAAPGSIFSLGFALGRLVYGALSDKYGRKKVIFVGLIFLTVISLLLGFVHSLAGPLVLRGLQGAAAATFSPVALAYAVEMFPPERRVTAIGFISTGFLVAGIAGQLISGVMIQSYGWNQIFLLLAFVYSYTALLVLWFASQRGGSAGACQCLGADQAHRNRLYTKAPDALLSCCVCPAHVLCQHVFGARPIFDRPCLWPKQTGYSVCPVLRRARHASLPVRGAAGQAFRRTLGTAFRGLMMAMAGLALLGFIANLPMLVLVTLLFVAGIALAVPSLVALVGQLSGKLRGIAVSMYTFILFAGTSVGPVMSMQFLKSGGYALTFILLALVLSIGLLASFFIDRDSAQEPGAA
ncbi:MFS transporter [Paenibacillus sp. P26]|nr:MFS transporter [Paenibacillus sp. P26]